MVEIGGDRHHADDLLQQVLADHVAAVQAVGSLVEDWPYFSRWLRSLRRMEAMSSSSRAIVSRACSTMPVPWLSGKELAADAVELFLCRAVAQRDDLEAELMVRSGQRLVEDLVIAGQADDAQLAHGGDHARRNSPFVSSDRCGGRLHRHSHPCRFDPSQSSQPACCRCPVELVQA